MKKLCLSFLTAAILLVPAIIITEEPVIAATGTINISTTSGTVGSSVTVTGNNFTANSTFTVTFGGTGVTSGTITAGGQLTSASFGVPSRPRSSYTVTVTTSAGDLTGNPQSFSITPNITHRMNVCYSRHFLVFTLNNTAI